MTIKLSNKELESFCTANPDWQVVEGNLTANFNFRGFADAVTFMQKVFKVAAEHNHHPTITNSYNRVIIAMNTHDADGAITERDTDLATVISQVKQLK